MSTTRQDTDLMVIAQPDWWSRLLALGALVVAAAALYWTYLQERDVKPLDQDYLAEIKTQEQNSLAEIKTAVEEGITAVQAKTSEQQERLANYVSHTLQESQDSLAEQKRLSTPTDSSPAFEEPMAQPAATEPPPSSVALDPPIESGEGTPESSVTQPPPAADLQLVYSALRVSELIRIPTATVRNEGDLPATITAVRFIPESEVDGVPLEVGRHDFGSTNQSQLVVQFTSADNQAEDPRAHGVYEQTMASAYRIEPGAEADIFVIIRNSQHIEYALRGRLVLLCATDAFSYDSVTIPFIEE